MLIECVLKRETPIEVAIGNERYNFEDDGSGRRVAEVWLEDHIAAFLACDALYRDADAPASAPSLGRSEIMAQLKARQISFKVTAKTDELRALLLAEAA